MVVLQSETLTRTHFRGYRLSKYYAERRFLLLASLHKKQDREARLHSSPVTLSHDPLPMSVGNRLAGLRIFLETCAIVRLVQVDEHLHEVTLFRYP